MQRSDSIAKLAGGSEYMIVPFAQRYLAVANGTVISLVKKTPRLLKPISMGEYVGLQIVHNDGVLKKEYLHRIIARTFLGEPPTGTECAHLDGNRMNCAATNLAWVSRSENHAHKRAHGTSASGESNPMHKLSSRDVKIMRKMRESGRTYKQIAADFNVATMTAHRAINKTCWGHI
ncbi:MAG TPA: HNH endonuclease [Dissulfurispiraceae bacterium]|nr:HNH endonuclease [Dissulfurispiraceae bacterium]